MKKNLAIILAVTMLMGMSVNAFAAENNNLNSTTATDTCEVKATYEAGEDGGIVYSVDISWGAMTFKYTSEAKGTWNPDTHMYVNAEAEKWEVVGEDANKITVTNHTNAAVNVVLSYEAKQEYSGVNGSFDNASLNLATAVGTDVNAAPSASAELTLSGTLAKSSDTVTVGTITVKLGE